MIRCRQQAWAAGNRTQYNRLRNEINRQSKKLRKRFYDKRIKGLRNCNSHNWWRETKRLTGQTERSELQSLMNTVADGEARSFAEMINHSLQQVSRDLTPLSPACWPASSTFDETSCITHIIEPFEVFNKLSRINVHKSPGPDGIPNWFLRDFAFAISEPICHIFNTSLSVGVMPSLWKKANVIPIAKSRPPKNIEDDLRPISLTPTLSKVLESLVGRWIMPKVVDKLDTRQYGARKGRSTTHALIDITNTWHQALDNRQSVRSLFIDYSKAFDHVDHTTVIMKMATYNIDPALLRWMCSFLTDRQQRVKIGNVYSDWVTLTGGMPQGTWFGPYVFLMVIDDLTTMMLMFKFVDDVTMTEILNSNDTSQMQIAAEQIENWSRRNFMNISTKKTKEMLFGSVVKDPPPEIVLENKLIERVTSFKLLGVTVTNNLSWETHVDTVCTKASKRLHFLRLLKRSAVSQDDLLHYYKSVIRPVLEYACPVWQSSLTVHQRDRLESIQRRAVAIITGSSDYEFHCVALDIQPVSVRLDALARSFFRCIDRPDDCLNRLLPAIRSAEITDKLREANRLPLLSCRTKRYANSFLPFALANYQQT